MLGALANHFGYSILRAMTNTSKSTSLVILCLLALLLGVIATAVAKILLWGIAFFTHLFYFQEISLAPVSPADNHLGYVAAIVPVIGGLIVGVMARYGSSAIRGHGIPEVMEKVLLNESRIPVNVAFFKPLSAAIAIGSGGPFGAEGPIIATGGAIGSIIGKMKFIGTNERKILLACGAAGGMTAIFGTPFSAVLLAIELLLFEFRAKSFVPVALSAVTAGALHFLFLEKGPFLQMPAIAAPGAMAFIVYLASGFIFGPVSVLVTKSIYFIEDQFEHLPLHWMWWPALGGIAVGLIGLLEPRTLGVGYGNIQDAVNGNILVYTALALLVLKFLSWAIALGSGTSGGTLAPLMTLGSLLGMLMGLGLQHYFPELGIDTHVMSLIGMAALFAGCSRALLASVVFALEATQQPLGIIPLLGACAITYLISHRLMETSIMTEKIVRRGVHVPHEYFPQDPIK